MKESLNETEKRRRRDDGVATRRLLLDEAARIFSEKGVGRTTSKEITAAAGTNTAAVNYYFGSIGKLYEELLVDAHDRLVSLDRLTAIASLDIPPQQGLARLIETIGTLLLASPGETASIRLLMREIFSPSPAFEVLRQRAILPKKRVMTNLVAETLDLPPDHPAVAPATIACVGPFLMLLIGEKTVIPTLFPNLGLSRDELPQLTRSMTTFMLGGLKALADETHTTCD